MEVDERLYKDMKVMSSYLVILNAALLGLTLYYHYSIHYMNGGHLVKIKIMKIISEDKSMIAKPINRATLHVDLEPEGTCHFI